jgi:hypothetical protein
LHGDEILLVIFIIRFDEVLGGKPGQIFLAEEHPAAELDEGDTPFAHPSPEGVEREVQILCGLLSRPETLC